MYYDTLQEISWEETTRRIASKTEADVRRALAKKVCNVDDFMEKLGKEMGNGDDVSLSIIKF